MLASGTARDIELWRHTNVELDGVMHEVTASVSFPTDDVEDSGVDIVSETPTSTGDTSSMLTNNHAEVFPPEYEQGVCQNIIYEYEEITTDVGREVSKTARACIDGCVSQGGRLIEKQSLSTATPPMGGWLSKNPIYEENYCFFEDPPYFADFWTTGIHMETFEMRP